jgi:YebC/PmpR family DNA-binding regulatory protein
MWSLVSGTSCSTLRICFHRAFFQFSVRLCAISSEIPEFSLSRQESEYSMAGHSKWKNIRLHKGKADLERGKIFGRLSREITIAAKQGGNPDGNPRLRLAIEKARENSMPADNIKRAIQKGTGELEGANYEEVTYEGYGPGGAAVLVEAATDNRNRTVAEMRHLFSKHGGNLGESNSVAWQFERKGVILVAAGEYSEDAVMEAALEAGAEDVQREGDSFEIVTTFEDLARVRGELEAAGISVASAQTDLVPQTTIELEGDAARRMLKLMDVLEDHDDVQKVAANFDIAESLLEEAER